MARPRDFADPRFDLLRRSPQLRAGLSSLRRRVALAGVSPAAGQTTGDVEGRFRERALALGTPRVLELGTKQSEPGRSTMHQDVVPHAREFLGTDIEPGDDVDIVADLHRLSAVAGSESFDIVLSYSTFEHLKYPTLAAHEVMKTLTVGGLLFVQTHQSFPLHGYPNDYFRFSRDALASLFGSAMGFRVEDTAYEFPAQIYSRRVPSSHRAPAYLNTLLWGEKQASTPDEYQHEL